MLPSAVDAWRRRGSPSAAVGAPAVPQPSRTGGAGGAGGATPPSPPSPSEVEALAALRAELPEPHEGLLMDAESFEKAYPPPPLPTPHHPYPPL